MLKNEDNPNENPLMIQIVREDRPVARSRPVARVRVGLGLFVWVGGLSLRRSVGAFRRDCGGGGIRTAQTHPNVLWGSQMHSRSEIQHILPNCEMLAVT